MPDTKRGRERKGQNKRTQLEHRLAEREREMDVPEELPPLDGAGDGLVAEEPLEDRFAEEPFEERFAEEPLEDRFVQEPFEERFADDRI